MDGLIKTVTRIKRKVITLDPILLSLLNLSKHNLRILMYHGISPLALPIQEFEKQLGFIKENFETYWVSEIPNILQMKNGKKPRIVLTFDDGLKNHMTNALPLIEKYGIKATFYIPVGLVENQEMLWNHEIRCLLILSDPEELPEEFVVIQKNEKEKNKAISKYIENLKTLNIDDRRLIQQSLRDKRNGRDLLPWMREEYQLMSCEDLKNMSRLVEIGSHSLTHPILTTISDDQLTKEIKDSRTQLELLTGKPIVSFCYPNGIFSPRVIKKVEEYYSISVSTEEGFALPGDRLSTLNRIPAGKNFEEFLLRLIRPTA